MPLAVGTPEASGETAPHGNNPAIGRRPHLSTRSLPPSTSGKESIQRLINLVPYLITGLIMAAIGTMILT